MLDKSKVHEIVEQAIKGYDVFLVDLNIDSQNRIVVELDSPGSMDIDTCAEISRKIEAALDRDTEDFELEVGSAGITAPFKVIGQYLKNIGNEIEVITPQGKKITGTLASVDASADTFTIEVPTKVKIEGKKKPEIQMVPQTLDMKACKNVKYHFKF